MLKGLTASWRTTLIGVCMIVGAGVTALRALLDDSSVREANWEVLGAAVMAGIGLMTARDNKTKSEAAGAK